MNKLETWLKIGKKNPWIMNASDPEFTLRSFSECKTIEEIKQQFEHGNWCSGQAFYYQDLCFINQVDGGDEWLTIKDDLAFESITFIPMIERNEFYNYFNRLLKATKEKCKKLDH